MKKIGILTGGGDCPGLNAVIRSVVERCAMQDVKVFGYHEGWRGVIEQDGHWMDTAEVESIQGLGGTILRTSRTNVMKMENGPALVRRRRYPRRGQPIGRTGAANDWCTQDHRQRPKLYRLYLWL